MSQKSNQGNSQRGINAYFKPKTFSNPTVTPAKRRSPALENEDADTITIASTNEKPNPEIQPPKTPSSVRRFKDVEALTPKKSPAGFPQLGTPLQVPFRSPRPSSQTARRFSSVSDLSSIPSSLPSSFPFAKSENGLPVSQEVIESKRESIPSTDPSNTSLPRSSQKIIHNGQTVAVRGSDEEDEDSCSSLEDLDDLLGRSKELLTSSSSPPSVDEKALTYDLQSWIGRPSSKRRDPIIGKDVLSKLRPTETKYKHALDSLLAEHLDHQDVEAGVEKLRKQYEIDEQAAKARKHGKTEKELDSTLLETVTKDGKEEESVSVARLMEAVKRTEALNAEKTWSFFHSNPCHGSSHYQDDFPRATLSADDWEQSLKARDVRQDAILSGYLNEHLKGQDVASDLVHWMLSAIASEPDDQLREMLAKFLHNTSPATLSKTIGPLEIKRLFSLLGASPDSQEGLSDSLRPNRSIRDPYPDPDWRYLISLVTTLVGLSQHLSIQARSILAARVCRMALDSILMSDLQVSLTVEDAISRLLDLPIDQSPTADFLVDLHESLYTTIQDPSLQSQLLKHILPTSDCASRFRVRLAHSFLLQAFPPIDDFANVAIDLDNLTNHLDHPRYDVVYHTKVSRSDSKGDNYDYSSLASWATILNIAVDDGVGTYLKSDSRPFTKADALAFNAQVDNLADKIKSIATSIRDTGASHMKRTEAKGALDILYFRLIHAVRTKPRPKRVMFGRVEKERETARSADFMAKHMVTK
ncbi:MAG: hypothetical protein Q9160_001130 [Pyrenula sp. 1 TL-2023]